jgi:uncharacterized protein involved in exopolysaccharide biosynthesis/Mrp family chromosome partitioning ATPase
MSNNRPSESAGSFTIGDVYFVIFRHKLKIIILTLLGIVAAVVFYKLNPPVYESEAQLFIQYITDNRPVTAQVNGSQMVSVMSDRVGGVINAEIQILRSFDLAKQVAATIGPEKILAKLGGGKDLTAAASAVRGGMSVGAAPNSSVIDILFQHPDPTIVQPVLSEIIADYQSKHSEIHAAIGDNDMVADEKRRLQTQIAKTDMELIAAKTNAGIISLEDAKQSVTDQISKIRSQLLDAELELDTRRAMSGLAGSSSSSSPTNGEVAIEIPANTQDDYNRICTRLVVLQNKNSEFMSQGYTEDNVLIKEVSAQIISGRETKKKLEEKFPGLASRAPMAPVAGGSSVAAMENDPAQLALLESKVLILNRKLTQLRAELVRVSGFEPKIKELTRTADSQEDTLKNLSKVLNDVQNSEQFVAGKITGIRPIQQPTPPSPADSKRLKIAGMMLGGGFFGALALAFLIEFFLDRTVKRPVDIENRLKMPLFMSIPDVGRNGARQRHSRAAKAELAGIGKSGDPSMEIAPWSANHSLRAFYEALRDRMVVYFDVKNVTHNPKLIAVTSANRGAGVTSMAMGLAASLSETGEGNVLLVDMNQEQGAVQQFYKGKPGFPLEDIFEKDKRGGALMKDNLYVVAERPAGGNLPRILPKRFNTLLPKFKASDYDYIIFDMPPVTQTSTTARLAGFMDMVLMVVEAEKSDQEVVRRANQLLKESKANVIAVLNKARKYVPEKLHQEYLSDS